MPSQRLTWWCNAFDPPVGGAELWVREVVRHFRYAGYEQQVIAITDGGGTNEGESSREAHWEGVSLTVLDGAALLGGGAALSSALRTLGERLAAHRPDVLLVNNFGHASLALLGLARSRIAAPMVLIVHNRWIEEASGPGSPLDHAMRRAAGIVTFDRHIMDWLRSRWPSARITCVAHAMPPLDAPPAAWPAEPQILYCGRLSAEKGPLILVEAMAGVVRRCPDARLLIAGNGYQGEEIQARVTALGLGAQVSLLGGVAPAKVAALIDQSFLVCVPSLSEGFGLTGLEAAWRGRPVVASDVGGLPGLVADGETGLLVSPGNPDALADALVGLIQDPQRAQAMGRRARAAAEARPSWEEHVAQIEAGIASVMNPGECDAHPALG